MAGMFEFKISIDSRDVREWVKRPAIEEQQKRNLLKRIGIEGENILKTELETESVTGLTSRSIEHEVTGNSVSIFSKAKWAAIAGEFGRAAGKAPPIAAIALWAGKAGVNIPAFLIARKIARVGTQKFRSGGPKLVTQAYQKLQARVDVLVNDYL